MTEAKKTVLFEKHAELTGKAQIVPFAGWFMPLWYQSIAAEHSAVRKTAGIFDCTHMAVLKVVGKDAANFLNAVATNEISMLSPGKAQYSYLLTPTGDIIDDIIVYYIDVDNFMVVANASNEQKVKDWFNKVGVDKIGIDKNWQYKIIDLKDSSLPDAKVDIALQGPASAECIKKTFGVDVGTLKPLNFIQIRDKGFDLIISRTGYTGAKISFEIFVHPLKAVELWDLLLEKGKDLGVIPCGLGSRDSLRIEAGLPLYGHELAGDFNISPFQAGYGWAVKLNKKNFIGKDVATKQSQNFDTEVARLKIIGGKGIRPIRQFDGILIDGRCIGYVLSCAGVNDVQIALALIEKKYNNNEQQIGVYYLARNQGHIQQGRKDKVVIGEKLDTDIKGSVVERFEKF
ncbi:MAG: glycine cleavage system protein T [Planctomycetes bacterium GWC2_45_44]|nr:MAG: glycine cleavage system protein T [Planctomycetes bacterium GWC2_45_44]HBR18992.1 glycine cleavage system aminomethyltransferase GcvT [Phycisphaerales bacterium]